MSIQAQRARFVPVEQGFNIVRPSLEPRAFEQQQARAFAADAPSGIVPLDLSSSLGTDHPATTPFMLARYVSVRAGTPLTCTFAASGEIWRSCAAGAEQSAARETVGWRAETSFCRRAASLPDGRPTRTRSCGWSATSRCSPPGRAPETIERAAVETTLYRRDDIARALQALYHRPMTPETADVPCSWRARAPSGSAPACPR